MSPQVPTGAIRVGCWATACRPWSALDHALECPGSRTEGLVGMVGMSVPKKKEKLPPKQYRGDKYTISPVAHGPGAPPPGILYTGAFGFQALPWVCRAKGLSKRQHHCQAVGGRGMWTQTRRRTRGDGQMVRAGLGLGIPIPWRAGLGAGREPDM